jgi:hypothetical protein
MIILNRSFLATFRFLYGIDVVKSTKITKDTASTETVQAKWQRWRVSLPVPNAATAESIDRNPSTVYNLCYVT